MGQSPSNPNPNPNPTRLDMWKPLSPMRSMISMGQQQATSVVSTTTSRVSWRFHSLGRLEAALAHAVDDLLRAEAEAVGVDGHVLKRPERTEHRALQVVLKGLGVGVGLGFVLGLRLQSAQRAEHGDFQVVLKGLGLG